MPPEKQRLICSRLLLWQKLDPHERAAVISTLHYGRQDAARLARVLDRVSSEYARMLSEISAHSAAIGLLESLSSEETTKP
jgi:hypothetical protein